MRNSPLHAPTPRPPNPKSASLPTLKPVNNQRDNIKGHLYLVSHSKKQDSQGRGKRVNSEVMYRSLESKNLGSGEIEDKKGSLFTYKMKMLFCARPPHKEPARPERRQTITNSLAMGSQPTSMHITQTRIGRGPTGNPGCHPTMTNILLGNTRRGAIESISFEPLRARNSIDESSKQARAYLVSVNTLERYLRGISKAAGYLQAKQRGLPNLDLWMQLVRSTAPQVWHMGAACYRVLGWRRVNNRHYRVLLSNVGNSNTFCLDLDLEQQVDEVLGRVRLQGAQSGPLVLSHIYNGQLHLLEVRQSVEPKQEGQQLGLVLRCQTASLLHQRRSAIMKAAATSYAHHYLGWLQEENMDSPAPVEYKAAGGRPGERRGQGRREKDRKYSTFRNIMLLAEWRGSSAEEMEEGQVDGQWIKQQQAQCHNSLITKIRSRQSLEDMGDDSTDQLNVRLISRVLETTSRVELAREKCRVSKSKLVAHGCPAPRPLRTLDFNNIIRVRHVFRGMLKNNGGGATTRKQFLLARLSTLSYFDRRGEGSQKCLALKTESKYSFKCNLQMALCFRTRPDGTPLETYLHSRLHLSSIGCVADLRDELLWMLRAGQAGMQLCLDSHQHILLNQSLLKPRAHPMDPFHHQLVTRATIISDQPSTRSSLYFKVGLAIHPQLNAVVVDCQCSPQAVRGRRVPHRYFTVASYYPEFAECIEEAYRESFPSLHLPTGTPSLEGGQKRHGMVLGNMRHIWGQRGSTGSQQVEMQAMRNRVKSKLARMIRLQVRVGATVETSIKLSRSQIGSKLTFRQTKRPEEFMRLLPCVYMWYHHEPNRQLSVAVNLPTLTGQSSARCLLLSASRTANQPLLRISSLGHSQQKREQQGRQWALDSRLLSLNVSSLDGQLRARRRSRYMSIVPCRPTRHGIARCIIQHSLHYIQPASPGKGSSQFVLAAGWLKDGKPVPDRVVELQPIQHYTSGFRVNLAGQGTSSGCPQIDSQGYAYRRMRRRLLNAIKGQLHIFID